MRTVHVPYDIPMRTTGDGTWLEAGDYEVIAELEGNRFLIVISKEQLHRKQRQLTIVRVEEVEQ